MLPLAVSVFVLCLGKRMTKNDNEILPIPAINQEFLGGEWQDIMCIPLFIVDQADVSSEKPPQPKGLMKFLNECKREFQENERGSFTWYWCLCDCCWQTPCVQLSSPLHNSRG